jgi:pilus assembly protein CpaF
MSGFEMILPFLKPIEYLIRDDSVSEIMINGPYRVFIERRGFLQQEKGISLDEKALMIAVKNIARRLGDDISESKPILDSRLPDGSRGRRRHPTVQPEWRHTDHPQVQSSLC